MLEWNVLDEDQEESLGTPQEEGPERRFAWWRWLLLLCAIIVGLLIWVSRQSKMREQEVRADLNTVLQEEIHAQASGFTARAPDLVDPRVNPNWYARYVDQFQRHYVLSDYPIIEDIVWNNDIIVAKVKWPDAQETIELRAYRYVNYRWRRTALPDSFIQPTTPKEERRTSYFMLHGTKQDIATITDDSELRFSLEALREQVVTSWPDTWDSYFLILNIEPQELSPALYFMDAQKFYLNRYELVPFEPSSVLSAKAQYRLTVIKGVIEWLTTPDWMREKQIAHTKRELPAELTAAKDWIMLYGLLQEAEARHWALDGYQRRLLRNAWRAEVGGEWSEVFAAGLPINLETATPEEKKCWLMVNLLIEREIAQDGIGTPGHLATLLQNSLPHRFSLKLFFENEIGASGYEFERITKEYLLEVE